MSKFTKANNQPVPADKPTRQPRQKAPKPTFTPDMMAPVGVMKDRCFEFIKGRGRWILCPICNQRMQRYKRPINRKMIETLYKLYKQNLLENGRWVSVDDIYTKGQAGDYAKMRFWGLIEPMDTRHAFRNSIGYWRITNRGKLFCDGSVTITKYAIIYDNECIGFEGDQVTAAQCYGVNFNFAELMAR